MYSQKSALCIFFSLKTFRKDSFKLCKGGQGVHLSSCKVPGKKFPHKGFIWLNFYHSLQSFLFVCLETVKNLLSTLLFYIFFRYFSRCYCWILQAHDTRESVELQK